MFDLLNKCKQKLIGMSLSADENIVGFGIGKKYTMGKNANTLACKVYVKKKLPKSGISSSQLIQESYDDCYTDVVEVGDIQSQFIMSFGVPNSGTSIGHKDITAGTIGCIVKKRGLFGGSERFILSNNHVLANSNLGKIGDNIIQPGPYDGGKDPIAKLHAFKEISFNGAPNNIDAALGLLNDPKAVGSQIEKIGKVGNDLVDPKHGMLVHKHGRTTQHTVGTITDVAADIKVNFGEQGVAWFTDQIAVVGTDDNDSTFSAGGDSGSLVMTKQKNFPVGLLFAGGGVTTFLCPIKEVVSHFDVEIV